MSNQLTKFESPELGLSLSGMLYKGNPVFDAVEVAKALGYADPHQALKHHCKSLIKLNSVESTESGFGSRPKGIQLARESDFYRLVLRSQLPSAEKVQDWVCEDVLPAIRQSGSYAMAPHQSATQEISMNNDLLSLARVVAEATASATMKAVIDVAGFRAIQQPVIAEPVVITSQPDPASITAETAHNERNIDQAEFVPVSDLAWSCGFSDAACRRIATFAKLETCHSNGDRGRLLVHRESFMLAAQALLDGSTPPTGKRQRWRHPEFGGFTLRLKSTGSARGQE